MTDQPPSPADDPAGKHANEFYVRRKLTQAILVLVPVWVVGSALWILFTDDDGHGSKLRVYAWSFVVLPGFLLIAYFMTWRCPRCNGYLGRSVKVKQCRKCNLELREP